MNFFLLLGSGDVGLELNSLTSNSLSFMISFDGIIELNSLVTTFLSFLRFFNLKPGEIIEFNSLMSISFS